MSWRKSKTDAPTRADADQDVFADVAAGLDAGESGLEFIYRSLDRLRHRTGADEVIAVLEDPLLGRQAFRAGGSPLDSTWARDIVLDGEPGIYTAPTATAPSAAPTVATAVLHLFGVALRLEMALHDSRHDHLTHLYNRRAFDEVLSAACGRGARYGWPFGLVLLDLDGFKAVNDRLGHPAGDAVLRAVGDELRLHLRVGDTAARFGGDEFAVLLPNLVQRKTDELVERVEQAIRAAVPAGNLTVSVSSGIALSPTDGVTPTALYHRADEELYEQKRARRR